MHDKLTGGGECQKRSTASRKAPRTETSILGKKCVKGNLHTLIIIDINQFNFVVCNYICFNM